MKLGDLWVTERCNSFDSLHSIDDVDKDENHLESLHNNLKTNRDISGSQKKAIFELIRD